MKIKEEKIKQISILSIDNIEHEKRCIKYHS